MGGEQSTRKISIDNDEPNNVIKVSEKVVERLKGSIEAGEKPNVPPRSTSANTVHVQHGTVANGEVGFNATSLDVKKQYEEELKKNNEYWERRLKGLQESHDTINQTWDREYKKALEDIDKNFPNVKKDKKLPCQDKKTQVLNCYKKNKDQPLLCANEVQAFVDCMNGVNKESDSKKN